MRFLLITSLSLVHSAASLRAALHDADVCIYGATSGGVIAAVQAARMGKSVLLLEPGTRVGGMSASGLGATDLLWSNADGGLAREFYLRVAKKYLSSSTTPRYGFAPHKASAVFADLLAESGVTPQYNRRLASVTKSGGRITSITTDDGDIWRASMYLDCSYEGDLLAAAGVDWTIGRESAATYPLAGKNEPGAGVRNSANHIFLVATDPYVTPGNPASGLLPLMQPGDGGTDGTGDSKVQAYNFRLCMTNNSANRIPITPPADYDPARYELLGRYVQNRVNAGHSLSLASFMILNNVGDQKTDTNNMGAISTDYVGGSDTWATATWAERAVIRQEHEDYIRGFFTFLATDSRIPLAVRTAMQSYGLAADEFTDNGGWPWQLYVREARRMISDYVMQAWDVYGGRSLLSDPVGLGAYFMDSHHTARVTRNGIATCEGNFEITPGEPFPISYRSIVPKKVQCENLLVTFALSASHSAFGAIRMEPTHMILSQSAATAAAIAIDGNLAVQDVPYSTLRAHLLADGQKLTWAPDNMIVVDDNQASLNLAWQGPATGLDGFYNAGYRHDSGYSKTAGRFAQFTPILPTSGSYAVYLRWTSESNRANNVPVDIIHSGGTTTVTVDQTQNGVRWMPLGTYTFNAGTSGSVKIRTDGTASDKLVILDAAGFAYQSALPVVSITATDGRADEFGSGPGKFTVTRTGTAGSSLTVDLSISGSAASSDYTALPTTATIPAGRSSAVISVVPVADTAAEGLKTVTLTILPDTAYLLDAASSATVRIHDLPFDGWRFAKFPGETTNPLVSGDLADPDGDGISNLAEYAMGLEPWAPDASATTAKVGSHLELNYRRPHPVPADVTYEVQVSGNLNQWNSGSTHTTEVSAIDHGDGTDRITVRDNATSATSERRFLRLKIIR